MSAVMGVRLFVRAAVSNTFRQEVVAAPVKAKLEELIQTNEKVRDFVQKHGKENIFIHGTGIGPDGRFPGLKFSELKSIVTNKPFHMMDLSEPGIYHSTRYAINMGPSKNRQSHDGESELVVDQEALLFVLPEDPSDVKTPAVGCPQLAAGKRADVYPIEVSSEAKAAITARSKLFLTMLGGGMVGGALFHQYEQTREQAFAQENK